jgi:hypothetical protein
MFLRLWVRAPRMMIASFAELNGEVPETLFSLREAPGTGKISVISSGGEGSM